MCSLWLCIQPCTWAYREQSRLSVFYQAKSADNRPAEDMDSGGFGEVTNTSSICVQQRGPSDKPLHIPLVWFAWDKQWRIIPVGACFSVTRLTPPCCSQHFCGVILFLSLCCICHQPASSSAGVMLGCGFQAVFYKVTLISIDASRENLTILFYCCFSLSYCVFMYGNPEWTFCRWPLPPPSFFLRWAWLHSSA